MNFAFLRSRSSLLMGSMLVFALSFSAYGQKSEPHYRKTKPLPPAANITLTVLKATNDKPLENASVIFRAKKDGADLGSLEVKTNSNGEAKIDIIEVGSHVMAQVIADGYASGAIEFDVPTEEKNVTVKMEKPRAQVSTYENNDGKASQRPAGVQEPPPIAPRKPATPPAPSTPQ